MDICRNGMKRIFLNIQSKDFDRHRSAYSAPIGRILRFLATGLDEQGRPCKLLRSRLKVDYVQVVKRLGLRPYFAWVYGLHAKYDVPCCETTKLRQLVAEFRSGSNAQLMGIRRYLCFRFLRGLFSYEHFCKGDTLSVEEVAKDNGLVIYRGKWKSPADKNSPDWSAWKFCKLLVANPDRPLRYCPYCNADSLYAFAFSKKGKDGGSKLSFARSALDHYYSQKDYPLLGLTLCNLVPSCMRCNSRFKRDTDVSASDCGIVFPYTDDMDSMFRFTWGNLIGKALTGGVNQSNLSVQYAQWDAIKSDPIGQTLVQFHIKEVYENMYAFELGEIPARLDEAYSLCEADSRRLLESGASEGLVFQRPILGWDNPRKRLLLNCPDSRNGINGYRLSKITMDLVEELEGEC